MTGVPAPKPKAYRPWHEITAELATVKDLSKALELAHELSCALKQQSLVRPEETNSPSGDLTAVKLSLHSLS
jgi:hypothetical protein